MIVSFQMGALVSQYIRLVILADIKGQYDPRTEYPEYERRGYPVAEITAVCFYTFSRQSVQTYIAEYRVYKHQTYADDPDYRSDIVQMSADSVARCDCVTALYTAFGHQRSTVYIRVRLSDGFACGIAYRTGDISCVGHKTEYALDI